MMISAFGIVKDLTKAKPGFMKLKVAVNTPFKTKSLNFNVWNEELLQKNILGDMFEKGDGVKLGYHNKDLYHCLDQITLTEIDNCPVCYSTLPATEAQRQNCDGCIALPLDQHKTRIDKTMILVSLKIKDYTYSTGYRLELQGRDDTTSSFAVVFPNTSFYSIMSDLRVGDECKVLGWKFGRLIDVIDFCTY
jgi:hypothetical protein